MPKELLLVAGEASGDLHGAEVLAKLRELDPGVSCFGLGGDRLASEGMELVGHSAEISVVGLTEALRILGRARTLFSKLLAEVDRRSCRTALLIDFPDFNLRLARELKKRDVEVVYYVSPQLWAWRRRRVKEIAKYVDEMLVLFGFEAEFYKDHDVSVEHVGHPLLEQVPIIDQIWDDPALSKGLPSKYRVALLPGSRSSEVEQLLPVLSGAAKLLAKRLPVEFHLIQAPTIKAELIQRLVEPEPGFELTIVQDDRFLVMAQSHLALCASGTATLEVGLLGTPMIVVYRLSRWTELLARMLVMKMPYYSLANLVLEEPVVPELLQGQARPEKIALASAELIADRERIRWVRSRLCDLRPRLGEIGASRRVAEVVQRRLRREDHES